jgi:hypothetical protein
MRSLSVDIETKATSKRAFILSIGVCAFDENGFYKNLDKSNVQVFYGQVSWDDRSQKDRVVSAATIQWWDGENAARRVLQSPNSQEAVYVYPGLKELLVSYAQFLKEELSSDGKLICQGTDFDLAIIDSAFEDFEIEHLKTWKFWNAMDLRSFKEAAHYAGVSKNGSPNPIGDKKKFLKHMAADDAMAQASIYQWYRHELWKLSQQSAQKGLEFIS